MKTAAAHDFVHETAASASRWCQTMGRHGVRPSSSKHLPEFERLFVRKQHDVAAAAFVAVFAIRGIAVWRRPIRFLRFRATAILATVTGLRPVAIPAR